jgi:hypothetical protein
MFKLYFNINDIKQKLHKECHYIKNGFEHSSTYLEDFYNIILSPELDAPAFQQEGYPSLVKIIDHGKLVDPLLWGQTEGSLYTRNTNSILKAIELNASIVFDHYYRYCQNAKELLLLFYSIFGCIVGCNGYLSQKDGRAYPIHADSHHVIVFALWGQKRWRVFKQKQQPLAAYHNEPSPYKDEEVIASGVACDVLMNPGDVLYIPLGQYHMVENLAKNSLHLTFSLSFKPSVELIFDAIKAAYKIEDFQNNDNESIKILGRPHIAYRDKDEISYQDILNEMTIIFEALKEISKNDIFIQSQKMKDNGAYIKMLKKPSADFVKSIVSSE